MRCWLLQVDRSHADSHSPRHASLGESVSKTAAFAQHNVLSRNTLSPPKVELSPTIYEYTP